MIWWRQAQRVQKQAHVFYFVFKHPRNPWYAKMIAACTAGYLLSPVQLIPSFIPGIGFLDDLLVLFLGVKLLQKITSEEVLRECRKLADAAEAQRKEEIRSGAALVVPFVIAIVWLLAYDYCQHADRLSLPALNARHRHGSSLSVLTVPSQ